MKLLSLLSVASLALLGVACERHSAKVTESALHKAGHDDHHAADDHGKHATENHNVTNPHQAPAHATHVNPAGSGPADPISKDKKGTGGTEEPGAAKYFPTPQAK